MESYKEKFHKNPTIDPVNDQPIKLSSKRYKELVIEYGKVYIISPNTHKKIVVGGKAFNSLIKNGYTLEGLLNINTWDYLSMLPIEALKEIILSLDLLEIISLFFVCKNFRNALNNSYMLILLSNKFNIVFEHKFDRLLKNYTDNIMTLLNYLSFLYHAACGFEISYEHFFKYDDDHIIDKNILHKCVKYYAEIFDDNENHIKITDVDKLKEGIEYIVHPHKNKAKLIELSSTTIPYRFVIIKCHWIEPKPIIWYNTNIDYVSYKKRKLSLLPLLKTRKYIKVEVPYEKVTISAKIKGSELTIDDILFAMRAFSLNGHQLVGHIYKPYKIINKTEDTLVLEPTTDFSYEGYY